MRTLVSLSAMTVALSANLGLTGCGGSSVSGGAADAGGTGSGGTSRGGSSSAGSHRGGSAGRESGGTDGGGQESGGTGDGGTGEGGAHFVSPCLNPTPSVDAEGQPTSIESCESGGSHRVGPVECKTKLPRAGVTCTPGPTGTSSCASDSDCGAQANGSCEKVPQGGGCECNYGCQNDADCAGAVCICGSSIGYCQAATCRSDDDCEKGLQCRGFQDPSNIICDTTRFECQTVGDTCTGGEQCQPGESCMADAATGEHHCQHHFCGSPGRPFLIAGLAVTAAEARRADWTFEPELDDGLGHSSVDAAALAEHWTQAALLEHASIAAFARFALQLLQLGAPAALVDGAGRAMADELRHAQLCFGLGSRYRGHAVGPSALVTDGCLEVLDLEGVLRMVVREGCIGETLAAVEAQEALEHASDPRVRAALAIIARDETRHAELAWSFVRWALERDGRLEHVLLSELAQAERARARLPARREPGELAVEAGRVAHGLLPPEHVQTLGRRVLSEVVVPLAQRLLAQLRPELVA